MAYTLKAEKRTRNGEGERRAGGLPAIVYGVEKESVSVSLRLNEFTKLYRQASESALIDLELDGKVSGKVLVQDTQRDPVSEKFIHVDLRAIDMNKSIKTFVELKFIGEPPAVKELGGTFVSNLKSVEVKCLPKDLVEYIDVDLNVLKTFSDVIKVRDLKVPEGIVIISPHAEDLVAKALPALTEEEIKKMEEEGAAVDVSKIEDAVKKPEKEEEGAEGAAATDKDKSEPKKEEKK